MSALGAINAGGRVIIDARCDDVVLVNDVAAGAYLTDDFGQSVVQQHP